MSTCRKGAPIFISFPHLLYADDRIKNSVVGIEPDENIHRTLFEVEPHTGLVLRAQKRLQINLYVAHEQYIHDFQNLTDFLLPVIWLNESTVIDQKSADDLNNQIFNLFTIFRGVSIAFICCGIVLFIITAICFTKRRSRRGSSARLLFVESHNTISHQDNY